MNNDTTLRSRAMLGTLNISVWNPKKTDRKVTLETLIQHGASQDAGAFVKNLLPDGAIDGVKKVESKLRTLFYRRSLPWRDDGIRILPAAVWFEFSAEMRALREEFDQAVGQFLIDYDAHRAKAKIALNGMFNDNDYPAVELVRQKFAVRLSVFPLPDSEDFRVDLPEDVRAAIGQEIDDSVKDSVVLANADLRSRLGKALASVVDRLSDSENIFRDTLITNLRSLCSDIPKLNISGDDGLLKLTAEAEKIAHLEPDQIRADDTVRVSAHKTAGDILAAMGIISK